GNVDLEKVRTALASALESAPASLQQPLALALATTRLGSETLLDVIAKGKASARLLQDKPVIDRLQRTELPDIEERIAVLTKNIPAIDDRLKQTIVKLSTRQSIEAASLETGAALFKKSCANCHRLNGEGGKVGPQLDGIGLRGMDRVVEDVIDPNRNVDAAFRATTLALSNGQILTGLKLREEGGNVIVADSQGKELTIPFSEIDESNSSNLSPMPSNVVEQIGEENLPHLIAFLLQQKQKKEEKDASGK
ncbi:MAG: c-type cytochrome, partial [Planctomycetes bacterium]|nr:c-type cytochrome [Planctomycetota bacterium]